MPDGAARQDAILVVDDDLLMLRLVGSLLVERGLRVHTATGSSEALRIAAAIRPDLILLDLHMEPCDGFATCALLKSNPVTAAIPVIFLTADTDHAAVVHGLTLGAVDYVAKPFAPAVLLARVRSHLLLGRLTGGLRAEVAARTAELTALNGRLKRLSAAASLVEQRERRQLAQGLHDGVIQTLALARARIGAATEPRVSLAEIDATLESAIADLRSLIFDLSPPELHLLGLDAALASLVERTRRRFPVDLALRVGGALDPLPEEAAALAFLGARELVANLIRHAAARSGLILAERDRDRLRVSVIDDGRGMDESRIGRGFGLFSLRQRLESFGGSLRVAPRAPGACVVLTLPLAGQASATDQVRDGS
ncbi:response regulator [Candidatus Thiodictyon syntrophicum]|uniref:ATP-binding response regulator n=1 Tax=Candidatus Thiodictyon syntrophicum TaxID=1166950 RepID=UPI001562187D|nr:response regulator [Candidatus Thiodictyon syntrophicum]